MDWLQQEDMTYENGAEWIDKFIDELSDNLVGLDPYPIALRGINWIKFISDKTAAPRIGRTDTSGRCAL